MASTWAMTNKHLHYNQTSTWAVTNKHLGYKSNFAGAAEPTQSSAREPAGSLRPQRVDRGRATTSLVKRIYIWRPFFDREGSVGDTTGPEAWNPDRGKPPMASTQAMER
jgi:hypothetical protein